MPLGIIALAILCCFAATGSPAPEGPIVDVVILDQTNQPVSDVQVRLSQGDKVVASADTDQKGHAVFSGVALGRYEVNATKNGFEPVQNSDVDLSNGGSVSVELILLPPLQHHDSINVEGTAAPVEQGSSGRSEVEAQTARELPSRPATVADALPLVPGVVRSPEGGLRISGSGEQKSALVVNSADVTDPATGQFGLTVPIDSVQTLNVYQTPFLAEYGRFTAALVSVETRRGGEKWKWELNDPFPEFRIRSYQLRGLRDATPRLNFEGPLIPGKLYFSEGFEYLIRKTPVYTLPFPDNQKKQEGVNSFAQLDWVASQSQLVTATVHIAPQRSDFVNMNYFNPAPVSPMASTHNYTGTIADRLTLAGGLLENTVSVTRFDANVWGQGSQDLSITPSGNFGNYFAQQQRNASRYSLSSTYSFAPRAAFGTHNVKIGSYVARSSDIGQISERPVNILDSMNQTLERITFTGGQPFRMSDVEYAFFGQDSWVISPHLAVDLGLRTESQQVSQAFRVAPRAGISWSPFSSSGTVLRAGFGLFYDRVPLNVYSFAQYPNQIVSTFAASQIQGAPVYYQNALGQVTTRLPFVFQEQGAGNFSPESANWSVQLEQPILRLLKLRIGYMQNEASGGVILNRVPPDPVTNIGAYVLSGNGHSRYRQFEVTTRVRLGEGRQLFFSYVRSRARGDLNDFSNYLGSFPLLIIRGNQFSYLPADLPNRFLAWGLMRLPWGFRIAPTLEYRSGFPYSVTDAAQNYVGVPNQSRFPNFLSVDSRVSKDFKVNPKYTVRLSVTGYNLTNHYNPEAVFANVADPLYGRFFGQRGRRFTADFDIIF